ncbi:MAG: redoxin domain-containing protein [Syntrophaceae bacterium]|nr:redoxin domain-containing protein [Syntrophaceae bacterium]
MRIIKIILVVFMFLVLSIYAVADVQQPPAPASNAATDFTLPDQDGKLWTLSEVLKNYRGVVLAFYPKDDTGL